MARPAIVDIDHYQGDYLEIFFRVRERIWNEATQTFDLGDYIVLEGTPSGWIKLDKEDTEKVTDFECTLADQETVPGGILAILTSPKSDLLTEDKYYYDIQVAKSADEVNTYLAGRLNMESDVTKNV